MLGWDYFKLSGQGRPHVFLTLNPESGEGMIYEVVWRKGISERGHSKDKYPEIKACLMCFRPEKTAVLLQQCRQGMREMDNRPCIQVSTLKIYAPDFHGKHSKIFLTTHKRRPT